MKHKMKLNLWVCFCFSVLILVVYVPRSAAQLNSAEARILIKLQKYLEFPTFLQSWEKSTDFCNLQSSSTVTVVCSNGHVTELSVIGNKTSPTHTSNSLATGKFVVSQQTLSQNFSLDSLFTVLTKLTTLKKLSLVSLGIWGTLPSKIHRFHSLEMVNISSNFIYGELPNEISLMKNLISLNFADNLINGSVPDLSSLQVLQELDLGNNQVGPDFPLLSSSLVTIILRNNTIRSRIPPQMEDLNQLQRFDASSNNLVGPLPAFIFSLPALWYLNLAENQLTGELPMSTSCGKRLWFVDISRNLLIGKLPSCIDSDSSKYRKVLSVWNCLSGSKFQHPTSFCRREALAVIPPTKQIEVKNNKDVGMKFGLIFGVIGGTILLIGTTAALIWLIWKRKTSGGGKISSKYGKSVSGKLSTRPSPIVDSKYGPKAMRVPTIGLPSYQILTIEELNEATNNFDPVNLVAEGSQGPLYRGLLQSGSAILVRCINVKEKHSTKNLKQLMEVMSQLRHQNLVCVLGHCVTYKERHQGSTVFVVFEHVTNGSLREHLTDRRRKDQLKWPQRMTISLGIARGVQFLHNVMVPGIFGNDLRIENILLDENLTPKVGNYKIPLPLKVVNHNGRNGEASANPDKDDIYNVGVILFELITGKQITSDNQVDELKQELERSLVDAESSLQHAVDLSMRGTYAYQSIKTAVELTLNCLSNDHHRRPPMEDVVWHLQYSIQAQQTWKSSGNLAFNSGDLGLE